MIFYHHTTEEAAAAILNSENGLGIKSSEYYLKEYIACLMKENLKVASSEEKASLPFSYTIKKIVDKKDVEIAMHAKWLGTGLYCFTETNLDAAQQYQEKTLNKILVLHIDPNKCAETDIFNMSNKRNSQILKEFLEDIVPTIKPLIINQQNETESKGNFEKLIEILKGALKTNFDGVPHAAGILIELFLKINPNYKIVKCSFHLGNEKKGKWIDEYVAIRELSILKKVTEAV